MKTDEEIQTLIWASALLRPFCNDIKSFISHYYGKKSEDEIKDFINKVLTNAKIGLEHLSYEQIINSCDVKYLTRGCKK